MKTLYYALLGTAIVLSVIFIFIVVITGKGDAMSGGGGAVRTTFKGKESFDDKMFKYTVGLAGVFMALMVVLDILSRKIFPT